MKYEKYYITRKIIIFIILILSLIDISCSGRRSNKPESDNKILIDEVKISIDDFHKAALNGNFEIVVKSIEEGMPVDSMDESKCTAMMLAAYNGHTEIVRYLLKNDAFVNHKDINNRTALIYASSGPSNETVKLLIESGAEVNISDSVEGFTAIMFAGAEGQIEVFKTLLAAGADITLKDKDGETVRDFALNNGHTEIVKLIDKN
ncbi:ankyrin repeat domain-containing protein [Bacteroidota bacterium]